MAMIFMDVFIESYLGCRLRHHLYHLIGTSNPRFNRNQPSGSCSEMAWIKDDFICPGLGVCFFGYMLFVIKNF